MHIRAQCEAGVVVSEPFLDLFDVSSGVKEQRRAGVPEYVKADRLESCSHSGRAQHPDAQIRYVERGAPRCREHGVSVLSELRPSAELTEFPGGASRQRDCPSSISGLRWAEVSAVDLAPDGQSLSSAVGGLLRHTGPRSLVPCPKPTR